MTTTAVLDTNALMMPVELGVRLFDELDRLLGAYEPVTTETVLAELAKLREGNGAEATAASVGRDLAERCTVVETEESYADDAVLAAALGGERAADDVYAVTNDGPLRDRLLAAGVDVIGIRGRNTLAITET